MTYKLPDLPSAQPTNCELADYLEISCLLNANKKISLVSASKALTPSLDEIENEGIESEDDEVNEGIDDATVIINDRDDWTRNRYPFSLSTSGNVVKFKRSRVTIEDYVYLFLLLVTRLDMIENGKHADIDGRLLFEELCELITKQYFGARSATLLLGTSAGSKFEDKIKALIAFINDGEAQRKYPDSRGKEKDGGADIVGCTHFTDKRRGKLISFCQCKTGTSWESEINKLQPTQFINDHFMDPGNMRPVSVFFVAEERVVEFTKTAGKPHVFFTRCRIMDYLPTKLPDLLKKNIITYVDGAVKFLASQEIHKKRKKKSKGQTNEFTATEKP
jgi:hypothetical protein